LTSVVLQIYKYQEIEWEQIETNTASAMKGLQSDQRIKFWHQRKKSVFWEGAAVSQKASDEADI